MENHSMITCWQYSKLKNNNTLRYQV
jgi:hypothetical protein